MQTLRFYYCTPTASEDTTSNDYILDSEFGILWEFCGAQGSVKEWLNEPISEPDLLAKAAREAGEWFNKFLNESEDE